MKVFRWCMFILVVFIFNFPLLATLLTSLKTTADISQAPPVWIFRPTLEHYGTILTSSTLNFPRFLTNSLVIALLGTFLAVAVTLPAAYAVVRFGLGKRTLLPLVTNLRAVPLIIFAIPFYLMFQFLGLLDTRLGLALIACSDQPAAGAPTLRGFYSGFPGGD